MTQSEWSRIERAKVDPTLRSLLRIQAVFEAASLESLFGTLPTQELLGRDA